MTTNRITSPDDSTLNDLCARLRELSPSLEQGNQWPAAQLAVCAEYGVFEWFLETEFGGQGWSEPDLVRGYLRLSAACLTTTFVITQRTGACRRIAVTENDHLRTQLLPDLLSGRQFATVGISHLTTSRRHLARPAMGVTATSDGFVLDGFSPWVTGAPYANVIVVGGTMDDDRQVLVAMPTDLEGVTVPETADLVGLRASQTGPVNCRNVLLPHQALLAGPVAEVMKQGVGARTGGLQTSTLAVGLADAAITFLEVESQQRPALAKPARAMRDEWVQLRVDLLKLASGEQACSNEVLRTRANSHVLRATQAALAAAKGSGYVVGHPVGRWCREALFFLVWSCPQPVMAANLCELAGISE